MIGDITRKYEGLNLHRYLDTEGYWTIGRGWNLDANPLPSDIASYYRTHGETITEDMAELLFKILLASAVDDGRDIWARFDTFTVRRQEALVDVIYNLGCTKITKGFPSFVAAVREGKWERAADELKYVDGIKKDKLSLYWTQLHGDPDGKNDGRLERPEEIYRMVREG